MLQCNEAVYSLVVIATVTTSVCFVCGFLMQLLLLFRQAYMCVLGAYMCALELEEVC